MFLDLLWSVRLLANNLAEVWGVKEVLKSTLQYRDAADKTYGWKQNVFPGNQKCKHESNKQIILNNLTHIHLTAYPTVDRRFMWRISGAGFLRLSGIGTGSLGRRRSFRVMIGFTSIESTHERNDDNLRYDNIIQTVSDSTEKHSLSNAKHGSFTVKSTLIWPIQYAERKTLTSPTYFQTISLPSAEQVSN